MKQRCSTPSPESTQPGCGTGGEPSRYLFAVNLGLGLVNCAIYFAGATAFSIFVAGLCFGCAAYTFPLGRR